MTGLIEEIQRRSLDKRVPVDDLLRRVKVAAAKLQLPDLASWVENELSGYTSDLPAYRLLMGRPHAWNPYRGWIPIHSDDEKFMEAVGTAPIAQAISSIQDIVDRGIDDSIHFPFPPANVTLLNRLMNFETAKIVLKLPRGSLVQLVDKVRNMVLDWALQMETRGIRGEGLSFDPKEKAEAQSAMQTFNIGSIGNFTGNLGSGNTSGSIHASADSLRVITETVSKIRRQLPALAGEGADAAGLERALQAIETEAASNANKGKLAQLLADARSTLSGAAGNLVSEGALALIAAALKALSGG